MLPAHRRALYWLVCSLLVTGLHSQIQPGADDPSFRWRIYPQVFDGVRNQSVSLFALDTKSPDLRVTVYFSVPQRDFVLDLQLNHDFISPTAGFFHQLNGSLVKSQFSLQEDGDCHFVGSLRSDPQSHVVLSLCNDFSGVIYETNETIYLTSGVDGLHYLHYDSRRPHTDAKCGYSHHANELPETSVEFPTKFYRTRRAVRPPFGAGARSRYVEMAMVLDYGVYSNYGHDVKKSHRRAIQVANIVNHLFGQLNVFVLLVGVQVWSEKNLINVSDDGGKALDAFLLYRRHSLNLQIPNDNAQLLTGVKFKDGVVGKALKGPICTDMYSGGVNMDHDESVALVASTVAHELGHNFGMSHDEDNCKCASEKCIMASSSGSFVPRLWSSCSVEQVALAFEQGMDYCLRNIPDKVFGSPQCGNGLVDAGEECDCGLVTFCNTTCCDPSTCKLTANATCANGLCCNLDTCQPYRGGYECRPAEAECDLPEYCDGSSALCPRDFTKVNGAPCDNTKSHCYEGRCSGRDEQCQLLWGPTGRGASQRCFRLNTNGNRGSNCGYIRENNTFVKCAKSDASCGTLYCDHLSEKLHFGMDSSANITSTHISYGVNTIICKSVQIDLGRSERDPGLVPNGVTCGEGKMCVDQKCVSVARVVKSKCSSDCGGASHGVCNSNGNCHCLPGWAPPFCTSLGNGGSVDSGPVYASGYPSFVVVMFVLFLGVVPLVGIFSCFWSFRRGRGRSSLGVFQGLARFIPRKQRTNKKLQSQKSTTRRSVANGTRQTPAPLGTTPDGTLAPPLSNGASSASDRVASELSGAYVGFSLRPLEKPRPADLKPATSASTSGPRPVESFQSVSFSTEVSSETRGGGGGGGQSESSSTMPRTTFAPGRPLTTFSPSASSQGSDNQSAAIDSIESVSPVRQSTARTTFRKRFADRPAFSSSAGGSETAQPASNSQQKLPTAPSPAGRTTFSSVKPVNTGSRTISDETSVSRASSRDSPSNSSLSTNASVVSSQAPKSKTSKPTSPAASGSTVSLHPRKSFKASRVDRQRIRDLGISDPIPQSVPDIDAEPLADTSVNVQRTHSHKPVAQRPPVAPPPCPPGGPASGGEHFYETLR